MDYFFSSPPLVMQSKGGWYGISALLEVGLPLLYLLAPLDALPVADPALHVEFSCP